MDDIVLLLQQSAPALGVVLFVFGACFGSFMNVIAIRLPDLLNHHWTAQCVEMLGQGAGPENEYHNQPPPPNLITPASRCPNCLNPLKIAHNIPIVSYIFLGGKCGFCQCAISIRYPTIEILTAVLSVHLGLTLGASWDLIFALIFTYTLITLSIIDLDHQILPDSIVIPLLWLGLFANLFGHFTDITSAVIGAMCGYLVLWSLYQVHHRITGKEGMGYGDFKLLAAIGAWLGWKLLPIVILLASISGTAVALVFITLKHQDRDNPIPFGPYLAVAAWAALIWGDTILENYLQFFNL